MSNASPDRVRRTPAFRLDLNTCVGCQACAIACVNEHALPPGQFWRQVVTHNAERRAGLPTYHLSIACNHCLDAPCERACPAAAIARDPSTGAVLIDAASCIGCRYCSWVCPYDAPKYDANLGVMQKCTFCAHRLAVGAQPACVSQCPTGALQIDTYSEGTTSSVTGFPDYDFRPAIGFVLLDGRRPKDVDVADWGSVPAPSPPLAADPRQAHRDSPPAISFRTEWSLALFTWVSSVMVAWQVAAVMGGPAVHPAGLIALAAIAGSVSTAHLGRPARAARAVLNWRRSWLSREVLAFALFTASALAATAWPAAGASTALSTAFSWAAACIGVVLVCCVDRVYTSMALRRLHSIDHAAAATATAFLAGVLAGVPWLFVGAGALRLAATSFRVLSPRTVRGRVVLPRAALRVLLGFGVPCLLWLAGGPLGLAAALVFAGELIDRADFYDSLDIVTPAAVMREALDAVAQRGGVALSGVHAIGGHACGQSAVRS